MNLIIDSTHLPAIIEIGRTYFFDVKETPFEEGKKYSNVKLHKSRPSSATGVGTICDEVATGIVEKVIPYLINGDTYHKIEFRTEKVKENGLGRKI